MLKRLKAFFVEDEEKPLPEPSPTRVAVNICDVYNVASPRFSEIIIDFLDDNGREKLFDDFLQPPLLIQFKKIFFQAIYQVDFIENDLRLEVMHQLNGIYSYNRNIDVSKIRSRYGEAFKPSLRSDEFATRVFGSEYVPRHKKMNELVEFVKEGGIIERPVKRMPKVLWDDKRGYYLSNEADSETENGGISRTTTQSGLALDERRAFLDKARVGKARRRDNGNDEGGGFHPV